VPGAIRREWKLAAVLGAALLLLVVLVAAAAFVSTPAGEPRSVIVRIYPGTTLGRVAEMLEERGVVTSAWKFRWLARLGGKGSLIKAGEYDLSPAFSPSEILDILAQGKVRVNEVTIPEGYTMAQVAAALEGAGVAKAEKFLEVCSSPALASELGVEGDNLEGYLFPDTYNFAFYMVEESVARRMVRRFLAVWKRYAAKARAKGMSMRQVVTLASIIEKETSNGNEMSLISSVFHNRLRRRMRLQSDPTVIYGLADFDGNLTRRHLRTRTPYNTYRVRGLPPGPIANPGEAAIRAALEPAESNYLYFVSMNDGSHCFSMTLAEHNRAVARYQKRRRAETATASAAGQEGQVKKEPARAEHKM
jgi:UPF0755 protein